MVGVVGLGIGFYDGMIGFGMGMFFVIMLVVLFGYDFL